MAVKRRKEKKQKVKKLIKDSMRIKCCYCDAYQTCNTKSTKEKSELMRIITYCSITPNKKYRKKGGNKNETRKNTSNSTSDKKQNF